MGGASRAGLAGGACMKASGPRCVNAARAPVLHCGCGVHFARDDQFASCFAARRFDKQVHPTRLRLLKGLTPPMTANSTDLVRADETASLWKSVLHTPSPRLSAATRDLLAVHTRVLERVPGQLRVAIDSSELDVWLRGGQLAALEASLASVTDA